MCHLNSYTIFAQTNERLSGAHAQSAPCGDQGRNDGVFCSSQIGTLDHSHRVLWTLSCHRPSCLQCPWSRSGCFYPWCRKSLAWREDEMRWSRERVDIERVVAVKVPPWHLHTVLPHKCHSQQQARLLPGLGCTSHSIPKGNQESILPDGQKVSP